MSVIDFHSHILPGIDDGSKNIETSLQMLSMASSQGVDMMVATPHFYASRHRIEEFLLKRRDAEDRLQAALQEHDKEMMPEIIPGAEVAFFSGISQADKIDALTIHGTDVMLLEMPFKQWTDRDIGEVRELVRGRHFKVILAHLERYMDIGSNAKRFPELSALQVYVQINAESISDGRLSGWHRRRRILNMFRTGQAHLLGSDCHGIHHRIPDLAAGRDVLKKKFGSDFLSEMDQRGESLLHLEGKTDV